MKSNKKALKTVLVFIAIMLLYTLPVNAAPQSGQDIANSGVRFATDVLNWLLILIPSSASLMIAYHSYMKKFADGDHGEIASRNKKIKTVLISSVIPFIASAIVRIVLSYFQ